MKSISDDSLDFTLYPNLLLLLWDRNCKILKAADSFDVLDERLANYIRPEWLTDDEKKVIQVLADRFGGGILNGWAQWINEPTKITHLFFFLSSSFLFFLST